MVPADSLAFLDEACDIRPNVDAPTNPTVYFLRKEWQTRSTRSDLRTRLPLTLHSLTEATLLTCDFFFHAVAFAGLPHARYSSISRVRAKSI